MPYAVNLDPPLHNNFVFNSNLMVARDETYFRVNCPKIITKNGTHSFNKLIFDMKFRVHGDVCSDF